MDGLLRRTLGEHIEINLVTCDNVWATTVDPAQLEAAILNLAVNARDAMPRGGNLTIEASNVELNEDYASKNEGVNPGSYVMMAVADTGTGMPPEIMARVFEPFFTTKEIGKGTGLGLSMVYGFAKQSNGHVKISSQVGQGTNIMLYLPRSADAGQPRIDVSERAKARGGGETILIVENDKAVHAYVKSQINSLGYRALSAYNGAEALEMLRQDQPIDLLFTDVVMPGKMNGPQLAVEARRLRRALKVLYTSGHTDNAVTDQRTLDPGTELLTKPYRRHDLAAKLRKVLDGHVSLS
jgi:CheY-like chemotaxis protein